MNKSVIYKYPLLLKDKQTIEMPIGYRIMCVQAQCNKPCVWAIVNHDLPSVWVKIEIYGTGECVTNPSNDYLRYIGTFQINNGHDVYHAFLDESVSVPISPKKCCIDRTKECDLCHKCDIDVSNPGLPNY